VTDPIIDTTPALEGATFHRERLKVRHWLPWIWAQIVGRYQYWRITREW
jgi:hypothetical protein